jgi:hypothetical protein
MDSSSRPEDVTAVLHGFCSGFASKNPGQVLSVFAQDPKVVLITSEQHVLRGPDALEAFLLAYAGSSTTYAWDWATIESTIEGDFAWLFAEGVEIATTRGSVVRTPYRMTILCRARDDRWEAMLVHGSSPHTPAVPTDALTAFVHGHAKESDRN